tara:strand:- start:32749 stop:33375 length:627 start_codon:yes stop_codon:yes gene_type:complete
MNIDKLKQAEANFLQHYPGGFQDPEMVAIGKKHNVNRMTELSQEQLSKKSFANVGPVLESLTKIVGRSSMVSMFEKPKFRDYVNSLNTDTRHSLAAGFKSLLHGSSERSREKGFNQVLDVLTEGKIGKWSLISICPLYVHPNREVFVKPTTAKRIIEHLELENLVYKPRPSWEFYSEFRRQVLEMKAQVDPSLAPSNAAFTGFLMMSL